jgi:NAD(P)-dependent dehydrogenase (short-subunit alcohol dehydrogenase family)
MSLIITGFDRESTADEVVAGHDLTGLRAVVTGASSGIGVETARSLARGGAEVTLAVRDVAAGRRVAADIVATTGNDRVRVEQLDLLDRATVERFAAGWVGPLHLLVNNAGIMACPLQRTPEGWEVQFATNHLGHFALTVGLHPALAAGAADRDGARIVSVSSSGHLASPVVFDDLHFDRRPYDEWAAYGQSKTANVLLAVEATRRWADEGIVANALMPGGIMTNLQKYVDQATKDRWAEMEASGAVQFKTPQQGAATTLVAAVAPEFAHTGGHYLEDCVEAPTVDDDAQVGAGVRRWALDPEAARRLWAVSLALLATSTR